MNSFRISIDTILKGKKYWNYRIDDPIGQTMAYLVKEELMSLRAAIECAVTVLYHPSAVRDMGGSPEEINQAILNSRKVLTHYLDQRVSFSITGESSSITDESSEHISAELDDFPDDDNSGYRNGDLGSKKDSSLSDQNPHNPYSKTIGGF